MVEINFGSNVLDINIPQTNIAFQLKPEQIKANCNEDKIIRYAVENPYGTIPLPQLVDREMKIAILCDDITRPTPVNKILPVILEKLYQTGIKNYQIQLIVALGSHRKMTIEELKYKFGERILNELSISQHNYQDKENLVDFGTTRRGTRVWLNKKVAESDFKIAIGNIVPHWPTGWSGGAKMLLPGVAGNETVFRMHLLGVNEQQLGKTVTPCREEMEDFGRNVGLDFILNTVLDDEDNVIDVVAGDFIAAHREGVKRARQRYGIPLNQKADITLSSTFPIDYDLFQADKGLFSAALATKPGGEIILISPCYEGISPTHSSMLELGGMSEELIWSLIEENKINDLLAAAEMLGILSLQNEFRLTLVAEGITKIEANKIGFNFIKPEGLQDYIIEKTKLDNQISFGVLNNSGKLLPIFSS